MKSRAHKFCSAAPLLVAAILALCGGAAAGTWLPLALPAPGSVQLMLLLTDGSVMCFNGSPSTACYRLTPGANGSYTNGTWTTFASMASSRRYFSSQVLQSGKVIVAGAEYGTGGATTELFDPFANSWTNVPVPGGLLCACPQTDGSNGAFRDSGSIMLPNGRVMVAPVFTVVTDQTLIYDPVANSWTGGPTALRSQNEATWVKLPDNSILTVDKNTSQSERFMPASNQWINDANVPVNLYGVGAEIGPALLLPNGRAFFLGGSTSTALYLPTGNNNPGAWIAGPTIPNGQACPDAPAAMLTDGHVLFACNPVGSGTNTFLTPVSFYEYDPVANTFTRQNSPTGGLTHNGLAAYQTSMLCLPDGTVLYSSESSQLYVYVPSGPVLAAAKPTINSITVNSGGSFHLTGTQLNGLSQGASYGDDEQMDSNYPIVRLTDGANNVSYATTFNWSSTGVATGNATVATEFFLPANISQSGGPYSLVVIANGVASNPVGFNGPVWVDFNYTGVTQLGTFAQPFKTLAGGATAVAADGNVVIKPGSGFENVTLSKAMTIVGGGGEATIFGQ